MGRGRFGLQGWGWGRGGEVRGGGGWKSWAELRLVGGWMDGWIDKWMDGNGGWIRRVEVRAVERSFEYVVAEMVGEGKGVLFFWRGGWGVDVCMYGEWWRFCAD